MACLHQDAVSSPCVSSASHSCPAAMTRRCSGCSPAFSIQALEFIPSAYSPVTFVITFAADGDVVINSEFFLLVLPHVFINWFECVQFPLLTSAHSREDELLVLPRGGGLG